ERNDQVTECHLRGDQLQQLGIQLHPLEVDRWNPVLTSERERQVVLGDDAELDQSVSNPVPTLPGFTERAIELLPADQAVTDQDLADPFSCCDSDHVTRFCDGCTSWRSASHGLRAPHGPRLAELSSRSRRRGPPP